MTEQSSLDAKGGPRIARLHEKTLTRLFEMHYQLTKAWGWRGPLDFEDYDAAFARGTAGKAALERVKGKS
jgi:hypothetical protein